MRLAVTGAAGAGAWGWPSAIWLTAAMVVVEGGAIVAADAAAAAEDEADIIDEEA